MSNVKSIKAASKIQEDAGRPGYNPDRYILSTTKIHSLNKEGELTHMPLYRFEVREIGEVGRGLSEQAFYTEWECLVAGMQAFEERLEQDQAHWRRTTNIEDPC